MSTRTYPGRLSREEWLRLSIAERRLLAARANSDLLDLWRSCRKKPCRRAHACCGDERCKQRPYQADFKNPDFGRPDFKFSFRPPEHLRIPAAILDQLPFMREPPPPQTLLDWCLTEADASAQAALRRALRLARRRGARALANTGGKQRP